MRVGGIAPLAGAYSNPYVQEQIAHLYRLVSQSSLEDPSLRNAKTLGAPESILRELVRTRGLSRG